MRVFVTGATGFIGSAIVQDLIGAGHRVVGLSRTDKGAAGLAAAGAEVHRGDIDDPDGLARGADGADAVIHAAFNHDFSRFRESCEADRRVIAALGKALAGSSRPLVVTSGVGLLQPGRVATETDRPVPGPNPRIATEEAAAAVGEVGGNVSLVRLPVSVHGVGDHGFVPILIGIARSKGLAAYVGEGLNRWPAVHRLDAARLYRLVLERGREPARYHAVAEEGIAARDIAAVIGRQLGVPVAGLSPEAAAAHFGWFTHFAGLDTPGASAWTRQALGWEPREPRLLADIDQPAYFTA